MDYLKEWAKTFITLVLLFGPFSIAIWLDCWPVTFGYFVTVPAVMAFYKVDKLREQKKRRIKKAGTVVGILLFTTTLLSAQYSGKMYQRALPEKTISFSVHPMSTGFGLKYDHMIFSTRSMMYYTLAADNFGVENSEATWPEHISASIGWMWCSPESNPKDAQLRAGFGIKYSSLHTVNGCQTPTIDLSDIRPELAVAIRLEQWLTVGVRVDLWEANSAIDVGFSF